MTPTRSTPRTAPRRAGAVASAVLLAAAVAAAPARAQSTPCEAVFEPVLRAGIGEALLRARLSWRVFGDTYVAAYVLEGEKANPFDVAKRREIGETAPSPAPAATPIAGLANARGVRCNVSAMSAKERVRLVLTAEGVRFKEGRGAWSGIVPNAVIAEFGLRRTPAGAWTIADLGAERAALPPDARLTPPPESLATAVAALRWPRAGAQPARTTTPKRKRR